MANNNKNSKLQRAIDLYKEGLSTRAIAKELDVGRSTVHRWIKEQELPSRDELSVQKHDKLVAKREEEQANIRASGIHNLAKHQSQSVTDLNEGLETLRREGNWNSMSFINKYCKLDDQVLKHLGFDNKSKGSSKIQIDVSVLKRGSTSESPIIEAEIAEDNPKEIED